MSARAEAFERTGEDKVLYDNVDKDIKSYLSTSVVDKRLSSSSVEIDDRGQRPPYLPGSCSLSIVGTTYRTNSFALRMSYAIALHLRHELYPDDPGSSANEEIYKIIGSAERAWYSL